MSQFQQEYDYTFKIALTGNSAVGKSSLMMRFTDDTFSTSLIPTVGVDFKIRSIDIDNKVVKLNIWDTAGQERFDAIISAYYRGIHACLIVFDVTDRQSFVDVDKWFAKYKSNARSEVRSILIGNKTDLEQQRVITYDEANALATELGMKYFETSAKTKDNVDECFIQLSRSLIKDIQPNHNSNPNPQKEKISFKAGNKIGQAKQKNSACC